MNKDVVDAANRLADVLALENAALKRMDFASAVALVPVKEAALADLARDPPRPSATAPSPAFVALGRRLEGLAEENRVLLERAVEVQTHVVRIVARAIAPDSGPGFVPKRVERFNGVRAAGRLPPHCRIPRRSPAGNPASGC
jgi:hypothetical protein